MEKSEKVKSCKISQLDFPNLNNTNFIYKKVQSIFFLNNKLTIAGLEILKQLNFRIPQDISIVSFDDIELFKFSYPTITSVSQPKEEIGKLAFETLLNEINNNNVEKQQITLPVKLNIRESCGSHMQSLLNKV